MDIPRLRGYTHFMKRMNIDVEDELLLRFKVIAIKEGKTYSQIVREFVEWYVEKREKELK